MKIIRIYKESRLSLLKNKEARIAEQTKLENMQGVGITLGSQISQVMALVAPNRIDHTIKDSKGIGCFERYMDDGIMLHESKEILLDVLKLQSYTTVTPFVTPEKPHYIRVFRCFVTKLH